MNPYLITQQAKSTGITTKEQLKLAINSFNLSNLEIDIEGTK